MSDEPTSPSNWELTLQMHDYDVPCFMQFMSPPCPKRAEWVLHFAHVEKGECPDEATPMPVCETHKDIIVASFSSFWQMWLGTSQISVCPLCRKSFHITRVEPIKPKG